MDPRLNGYGQQQQHQQRQASQRQHQRFSWQAPVNEPAESNTGSRQPQQSSAQPDSSGNSRSRVFSYAQTPIEHRAFHYNPDDYPVPQLPTQNQLPSSGQDRETRALSYAKTPVEHRAPQYPSNQPPLPQSPPTPIDPRPQSIYNTQSPPVQGQPQQGYLAAPTYTDEKPPFSPVSPQIGTNSQPLSPVSPIVTQPTQVHTQQQGYHARQRSNLSPINTNLTQYAMPPIPATPPSHNRQASPLPYKNPITPISPDLTTKSISSPREKMSGPTEPYSPHGLSTTPSHAVFSPHSAHGPNGLDFALHQPGQIAHPNMDLSNTGKSHSWKNALCSCNSDISTCLTGLFCPCVLYGRTSYRLSQKAEKKDPTDMLAHSSTNGHCMLMSVACGLWWVFPMIQRTRIRHAYKLEGGILGDLARGCCCCCCVAIQNEREVRGREESQRRFAGPASTEVYTSTKPMIYSPQQ